MRRRRQRHRIGFTLIELLVVMAIISLLITLLAPSLGNVRDRARSLACKTHLRQLGFALYAYAGDHQGAVPPRSYLGYRRENPEPGIRQSWHARLIYFGYLGGDSDVFYCPAFPPYNRANTSRNPALQQGDVYGMRVWTQPGESFENAHIDRQLSWIRVPSDFFLLVDSIWLIWMTQGYGIYPGNLSLNNQRIRITHGESANTLFADGSVADRNAAYFQNLHTHQGEYGMDSIFYVWPE